MFLEEKNLLSKKNFDKILIMISVIDKIILMRVINSMHKMYHRWIYHKCTLFHLLIKYQHVFTEINKHNLDFLSFLFYNFIDG